MEDFHFEATPYEDGGVFLEIQFEGETEPTVLYVAERDLAGLMEMVEDEDTSWRDVRSEIFSLLEHSGHEREHRLGQKRAEALRRRLRELDVEADSDSDPSENGQ